MLNLRTLILGLPRTCPLIGLENEPKYSEKQTEFGTVNWTPYLFTDAVCKANRVKSYDYQIVARSFRSLRATDM